MPTPCSRRHGAHRSSRPWPAALLLSVLLGCSRSALAAHPLQTEDTGTQGAGNLEFENGLSLLHSTGTRTWTYQPQLSIGAAPSLDLIVQPSWLDSRSDAVNPRRGRGDTNLDLKWRFFGSAPFSAALRAGATAATSEQGLGLPRGTVGAHALLVATIDAAPFTVHGNLGLTRNPQSSGLRREMGSVSGALMWAPNERLTWTLDGGSTMNADPSRHVWVTTLLAGMIYTVRPGLDVDAGLRASVRSTPSTREWLMGVTYRFGL